MQREMKRRMMLYFGSFNPIHKGHLAVAEWVVEHALCDELALIVSPQSPYKQDMALAPELARFEMAEAACSESPFADRIRPSVVEMLLPKPSYTIDTLRCLEKQYGDRMTFSILMGGDQLAGLSGWKEYERILDYPIYVYPRRGQQLPEALAGRVTLLEGAPLWEISSTEIRRRIECGEDVSEWLSPKVLAYIRQQGLWSPAMRMAALNSRIAEHPEEVEALLERGKLHFRMNEWGAALNDFNRVRQLDPAQTEAAQFAEMVQEILAFRYKDIYNP